MKTLTKQQIAEKTGLVIDLNTALYAVETAIAAYNDTLREQQNTINAKITTLNEIIDQANQWRSIVEETQRQFFDDKSEKWQESDNGQDYAGWLEAWEIEFESVEEIELSELETPECNVADDLDALPDTP